MGPERSRLRKTSEAEDAPTEIQIDQQRQFVQAGKDIFTVQESRPAVSRQRPQDGAHRDLGIFDENGEFGEAGAFRFA
jgi:hypothetical protein